MLQSSQTAGTTLNHVQRNVFYLVQGLKSVGFGAEAESLVEVQRLVAHFLEGDVKSTNSELRRLELVHADVHERQVRQELRVHLRDEVGRLDGARVGCQERRGGRQVEVELEGGEHDVLHSLHLHGAVVEGSQLHKLLKSRRLDFLVLAGNQQRSRAEQLHLTMVNLLLRQESIYDVHGQEKRFRQHSVACVHVDDPVHKSRSVRLRAHALHPSRTDSQSVFVLALPNADLVGVIVRQCVRIEDHLSPRDLAFQELTEVRLRFVLVLKTLRRYPLFLVTHLLADRRSYSCLFSCAHLVREGGIVCPYWLLFLSTKVRGV